MRTGFVLMTLALLEPGLSWAAAGDPTITEQCGKTMLRAGDGKSDMAVFLSAVSRQWPSQAISAYLASGNANTPGSVYAASSDLDDDELEDAFEARILKTSAGDSVFVLTRTDAGITAEHDLCVYDYHRQAGEFVPRSHQLRDPYAASGFAMILTAYDLEEENTVNQYTLIMTDESDMPLMSIGHAYKWDGSAFTPGGARIYTDSQLGLKEGEARTRMVLTDLDGDHVPELWLASDSGKTQDIFTLGEGTFGSAADSSYGPPTFRFCGSTIVTTDPDGMEQIITVLKDSTTQEHFRRSCTIDDSGEKCVFYAGGKQVPEQQWQKKVSARIPDPAKCLEIKPSFEKLLGIE